MPDSVSQAQRQRRANWVALRTLRQLPKAAGQTKDGDAVFEVRSVRMVLRRDAGHFNRLVHCSKCRREVVGSPVMTADDLERSPSPVICQACVKGSALPVPWSREEPRAAPAPQVEVEVEVPPPPVEVVPVADDRVGELERQLEAVVGRLAEVAEELECRPTEEVTQAAVEAAVHAGLADARAQLASWTEETAGRLAGLDGRVREGLGSLAKLVDAQRAEVTALAGSVREMRATVDRLTEHLSELAARPAASAGEVAAREALAGRVDDLQSELAAMTEAQRAQLGEALERGLAEARLEATSREQEIQHGMSRLSAMIATLRDELQTSTASVGVDLAPVVQAQNELAASQRDLGGRLEALGSSVHAGEARLEDLETRVQEALRLLISRLDRATTPAPPAGSLLETLDAQLRAAESRLAERAGVQQVELLIGSQPGERADRTATDDQGWLFDQDESGVAASPGERGTPKA